MAAELCMDWSNLVGLPVELRQQGKYIRSGVVDAAMPDSSALWLAAHGADDRQMFEAALGSKHGPIRGNWTASCAS